MHRLCCGMPRKPQRPPNDPEEYKRFRKTAKQVEADDDPEALERAFKTVVRSKTPQTKSAK